MSLEANGFGLVGGEVGVAIRGALVCCLVGVAAAPDVIAEGTPLSLMEKREETSAIGN